MDSPRLSLFALALALSFAGSARAAGRFPVQEAAEIEAAVEAWAGTWEGRIEGAAGVPMPEEGVLFRMTLGSEEEEWEGRIELLGQASALSELDVDEVELTGSASLFGFSSTFRFERAEGGAADAIVGEFESIFTVRARATRMESVPGEAGEGATDPARVMERLWSGDALVQAGAPKGSGAPDENGLTIEEKIAGLSHLWSEVKFNFAFFDQVPELDWDAEYLEALTRVLEVETTSAYYLVLRELVAKLEDGHTNVYFPPSLMARHLALPPVGTLRLQGRVIVTEVLDEAVSLRPGWELLAIDGVPTDEYAQAHIAPYVCSSTDQDRERQVYGPALLRGASGSSVRLAVRDENGATLEVVLERALRRPVWRSPVAYEELDGEIGYVEIRSFQGDAVRGEVEKAMAALAETKGLILDIRDNGGGSSGWWVMEFLVEQYQTSAWSTRNYLPVLRARGQPQSWYEGEPKTRPGRKERYEAPVILLTSAKTASAAEDFASVFKYSERGTILGQPTCGSSGQPLAVRLPGGGSARICTKRDMYPDGGEWVGFGVEPDVLLAPTVADYRDGTDSLLDAALRRLQ